MNLACFSSYNPVPSTIDALAYLDGKNIVAEGLSDGSIRILDATTLAVRGFIPGHTTRSVRRIAFHGNSLISCGVNGSVTMWDLATLREICSLESSQGAVWDMAVAHDRLYLATETGCVIVVDLSENEMRPSCFWRSPKTASPVRSLSVCVSGGYLFVGNASGTISRWDISSGVCDSTFTIPAKNGISALVWTMVSCGEGQFATGDSLGSLSLWDTNSCTLIQSRQDHQADILVMARFGDILLTTGVDARVARYKLNTEDRLNFTSITSLLSRDISAIAVTDDKILIAGADGKLGVLSLNIPNKFIPAKLDRFRERVNVQSNRVYIQDGLMSIKIYSVEEEANTYLAELKNSEVITCFAVSEDGKKVMLSDVNGTSRLLAVVDSKVSEESKLTLSCHATAAAISERLQALVSCDGNLVVIDNKKQHQVSLPIKQVSRLVISGSSIIAAGEDQVVIVSAISKKPLCESIKFDSPITAVSDIFDGSFVIVATADHFVHSLDITKTAVVWKHKISNKIKISTFHHVNSIVVDESKQICLFGESFVLTTSMEDPKKSGFKFHSTVPMGGVVIGSGILSARTESPTKKSKKEKAEKSNNVLAVLANYKTTEKLLISPFERKAFQH
jgi:WD40 repeat protein